MPCNKEKYPDKVSARRQSSKYENRIILALALEV